MKKYILVVATIITVITFLILHNYIPRKVPLPIVLYNGTIIPTVNTFNNWFNKTDEGNSLIGPPPEEAIKNLELISVKPNGQINIKFNTLFSPKKIEIIRWENNKLVSKVDFESKREAHLVVPNNIGIYVFEINGIWDETHTSSYSFWIKVD